MKYKQYIEIQKYSTAIMMPSKSHAKNQFKLNV